MRTLPPVVTPGPRSAILSCVVDHPGMHLRGIERHTNLPLGQVLYHLDRLERMGLVVTHRDRGFRRFFSPDVVSRSEKPILSALRHDVPRHVVLALLAAEDLPHKELQRVTGVAGSTLSFHLQRLVESGVLVRTRSRGSTFYALADPQLAEQDLRRYAASLRDPAVDRFLASQAAIAVPVRETASPVLPSEGVPMAFP